MESMQKSQRKTLFSFFPLRVSPHITIIKTYSKSILDEPPLYQEVVMTERRTVFPRIACLLFLALCLVGPVWGQGFSPAQEQEFIDARQAVEQARSAQAEKYAAEALAKSGDLLLTAEKARASKDSALFTQASRLARAHAELAEAAAGLKREEQALAEANDALKKVKAEIEQLNKSR
jgi:hypothetical protein